MVRPTDFPEWATSDVADPVSNQNNVIEPPAAWKTLGWDRDEQPTRNYQNWLHRVTNDWLQYLEAAARPCFFVAAADASDRSKERSDYLCDGTADEFQIQAALDAAAAAGGGVVLLSEGTFNIAASILMKDYVTLRGIQRRVTTLKAVVNPAANLNIIHAVTTMYWAIKELFIDCNGRAPISTSKNVNGLYINTGDSGSNQVIEEVEVYDAFYYGSGGGGGFIVLSTGDISFKNCIATSCKRDGFSIASCANVKLINCRSDNNVFDGFYVDCAVYEVRGCRATGNSTNYEFTGSEAVVTGCRSLSSQNNGITCTSLTKSKISLCNIRLALYHGLYLDTCSDLQVIGNYIGGNSQHADVESDGIYVLKGSGYLITGNIVRHEGLTNQQAHGFDAGTSGNAPSDCALSGNDLYGSGKTSDVEASITGVITIPDYIGTGTSTNTQYHLQHANNSTVIH